MTAISNNQIVIVTGLPRSGTSMMMKMLEAGGVPSLCDGQRVADSDNPNGYYEFEPVKQTKTDASWLNDAPGKAVKMVYSLLYDLPTDRSYDVVFMRRELNEILASQNQMLRNMQIASSVDDDRMGRLFQHEITKFIRWLETADHINCIEVGYNDVAAGQSTPVSEINAHLGGNLNTQAMSSVVDPSLYRNRAVTAAA